MWDLHDRLDMQITEESCRTEIDSFTKHGQLIPVLGRLLISDPTHKVELIYGARRLFVARHLNVPLHVELRETTDREAIVAMDIENRQRTDISAYERGLSYARFLRVGHFKSQDDIARALRISASQVSRLLKLAQLPPVIVDAFDSPASICEGWGLEIIQALDEPLRRQATIRVARSLGQVTPRLPARQVFHQMMTPAGSRQRLQSPKRDEVVKDTAGRPLFRIRRQSHSIAFVIPLEKMKPDLLDSVSHSIAEILQRDMRRPLALVRSEAVMSQEMLAAP
jgi:ParB family chromosome partitioning protein